MLVYEAIGETLKRLGVKTVFGLMGDGNMRYIAHMDEALGLRFYGARHESGAVAMADGFSRVSNQVGVCTVTEGPGVTNAMSALTEALKAGSGVLMLAGDTPTRALRHNQDINQEAVFSSTGVGVQKLRGPGTIVPDLVRAWNRVLQEQRPVAMSIPVDWQTQPCASDALDAVRVQSVVAPRPEDDSIKRLCELIAKSERPLIIAGRGAVRSDAREALEALGERIGALYATSVQAKGFFSGNRYDAGISGGFASDAAATLFKQADLLIAFGTSLGPWITRNRELLSAAARIVHVDSRPAAVGALTPADLGLVGDARATAQALGVELERKDVRVTGFHAASLQAEVDALHKAPDFPDESDERSIDPRTLMGRLESMLPAQRTVVVDSGHAMGWATQFLSVPDAHGFIFGNDFMVVGLGLATAFGAAIARPDRLTVVSPGDGGLMMHLGEMETLVRYGMPILVLAINDAAYGVEVHILRAWKQSPKHAFFSDVDFAAVAKAFGARGLTVRKASDLNGLQDWLAAPRGPMVVDCKVNPQVIGEWFKENLNPNGWLARMSRG